MKPRVSTAAVAILVLCFTILPGVLSPGQIATVHSGRMSTNFQAASLPSNKSFDYILIILMENNW